jgi:hypothetical protein
LRKEKAMEHNKKMIDALEHTRHALVALGGLYATDGFNAYERALTEGCDSAGAWRVFKDQCLQIDESKTIAIIDEVLAHD